MSTPFSPRTALAALGLMFTGVFLTTGAQAQTLQTSDYIYIGIEAEDHIGKDDRWVLTDPTTPATEPDPDGNHSDGASGSQYLELLPDIRVTHDDPMSPPTAYWGQGGQGPYADYAVDFPEPGRYYVHVRAFSTGTEDNGIHIGLNGNWPQSGQRMQFCTASRNAWWWSSAQRDGGGNGSCGMEKTIWLDVPAAGLNTVSISAREDGFEIDRLALIKDMSGNTKVCSPVNISGVNCQNGSIESADGFIDLRVRFESEAEGADPDVEPPNPIEIERGSNLILTANIENLDNFDTANDIVLTLTPGVGDWAMVSMDNRCSEVDDEYECTLDSLRPTAPNEFAPFVFVMQALVEGDRRIDASVISNVETDDEPGNDVAATVPRVLSGTLPPAENTDVRLAMDTDSGTYEAGESVTVSVDIENTGNSDATDVTFSLTTDASFAVNPVSLPAACTVAGDIVCSFNTLSVGASTSFDVELYTSTAGVFTVTGSVSGSNDDNSANNLDSDSMVVTEPDTDDANTGGSSSSNGTGKASYWFLLGMLMLLSARGYWLHQRKRVAVRK